MTTVIIKHFVILTFTAQARAPQVISADRRGFQARRCFFSSHVMVLVEVVVMFLVVSCFASVHVRSIKVSTARCSPSLWGQRAAVTAGYSCPPAVPSPPELWSALPPEQRHKLPANTRQPRINYSLQLTRHQDDDDHHRPPARRQTPLTSFFSSARTLSLLSFSVISSASCCRRSSITAMFRASFSDSIPFSSSSCRLCKSSSEICRRGDEVSDLTVRRHFCKDQVLFFF